MPKPSYTQKFRDAWLKDPLLKDWLLQVESTAGPTGKCKYCNCVLTSRYADLKAHASSKKHTRMKKLLIGPVQPRIPFKKEIELTPSKLAEAKMSLFVAQHTSVNVIDHLINITKNCFGSCNAGQYLKMHRTKCGNIIRNVLAPHFIHELREDVGDNPFSILIDESTDISVQKYLGIVIIYFSTKRSSIISTFLDLAPLETCDADSLVNAIKTTLHKFHLDLNKLTGLGTDNASVMTGVNGGVYKKLKDEVPHLILTRCVCHSLQLAVSAAAKECLPRNLEFLVQETYNWFSHSTLRQAAYKRVFETLNENQTPLKIVQACQTRWLSIESAVSRLLDQWEELKCHFNIARLEEKCYTAEMLYQMYSDDTNHAFLFFLRPVLEEVQRVNKLFESKVIDPTVLTNSLSFLIDSLVNKITVPGQNINIFEVNIEGYIDRRCYLSYGFENKIHGMRQKGFSLEAEEQLRNRCISFVVALIHQVKNRLPENIALLKKISTFSICKTMTANKANISDILLEFGEPANEISKIESQWSSIHLLKWEESTDTVKFWTEVHKYRDGSGENPFKELSDFVIKILIIPHSNADVERLFSNMNLVKSKLRNRLQLPMLTSILQVRSALKRNEKCCDTYTLPESVIQKIKSNETYTTTTIHYDDVEVADLF